MATENYSEQQVDLFDLLPNALVYEIFNRVEDARSLSACAVACKRFGDLVAETHNVSLEITRRNTLRELSKGTSSQHMNKFKGYIGRFVLRPIHALLHRMSPKKSKTCPTCGEDEEDDQDTMFRLPNDMLKKFDEIRSLSVNLPGHEEDISSENTSGALLKWKANFGKELESCVILGATGFQKSEKKQKDIIINEDKNENIKASDVSPPTSLSANLTTKQLKKRVVWTISCLIASSARHHMLKQIIAQHPTIQEVKISDGSKQGTIEMSAGQVTELRADMKSTKVEMDRTKIPGVTIKMWYMPVLELPECGGVMKGATLAVIRPTTVNECDVGMVVGGFGEGFTAEAVRKLVGMKKSYTLEMNSF